MKDMIVLTLTIVLCAAAYSQDLPIKWKQVDRSQLAMQTFPSDSSAEALVLCDFGESSLTGDFDIAFERHVRIKIFKQAGYNHGSFSITYHAKDERIRSIDGITYAFAPDSSITMKEMEGSAVFEEDVDGTLRRKRFTLPGLTPGCVIDVRYKVTSSSLFRLRNWRFQRTIPTLWSEYRVTIPKSIAYAGVVMGFEPFHINETSEIIQRFDGEAVSYLRASNVMCNRYRWVVRNASALREEPYITTLDDYENRIELQLAAYADPNGGIRRVLRDWTAVRDEALESDDFGGRIEVTKTIRKLTEDVTHGLQAPFDRMKAIYDYIRTSIVWSERNRYSSNRDVEEILDSKNGSSAEITFLLLSMLKSAGIEAHPIVLSTRPHGVVQEVYPIVSQFDYVLAQARVDGTKYFLDATDPMRPFDLLPVSVLNVRGLLIAEGPIEWVTLVSKKKLDRRTTAYVALAGDGELKGHVETIENEYSALRERHTLEEKTELEMLRSVLSTETSGVTLDSSLVSGRDSTENPLRGKATITGSGYAQSTGDLIYVNPLVVNRVADNPLKREVRRFPVDMAYGSNVTTVVRMNLPADFSIHEAPSNRTIALKGKAALYSRSMQFEGNQLVMTCKLEIENTVYPPTAYRELRNFFSQMVAMNSEQIVLRRASSQPPAKKN